MSHSDRVRVPEFSGARALFTSVADANLALHVGDDPAVVARNRAALEAEIGKPILFVNQVHSALAHVVSSDSDLAAFRDGVPTADAIVTDRSDVALGIMVADCVPVLFVDEVAGVVGAAHAGRKGLLDGVVDATIRAMVALGAHAADIRVLIGPSVCGKCYEVPEAMRRESVRVIPEVAATTSWGTASLDLPAGVAAACVRSGVALENVEHARRCTLEDSRQFSYRRDPHTGRFAGLITRV